jgi:hypothetical protein
LLIAQMYTFERYLRLQPRLCESEHRRKVAEMLEEIEKHKTRRELTLVGGQFSPGFLLYGYRYGLMRVSQPWKKVLATILDACPLVTSAAHLKYGRLPGGIHGSPGMVPHK